MPRLSDAQDRGNSKAVPGEYCPRRGPPAFKMCAKQFVFSFPFSRGPSDCSHLIVLILIDRSSLMSMPSAGRHVFLRPVVLF